MADLNDPKTYWWRNAVIYQVYVRSFADSDGDGIGDLPGITSRLPHLADLGVDALWITPFYTSPQHDHGYDVADYRDVDPLFGSLSDADDLIARAHELGLRVVVDLVPNHTSDQHEWFQAALAAGPGSPERGRYLFRDSPEGKEDGTPPNNWESVFGGPAWTQVDDGQWYLHLFDSTQPDLDWRNPEVPAMFEDVLRFWLDRGVDGFRVDVAHGLFKEASLRDQVVAEGGRASSGQVNTDHSMVSRDLKDEPMWDQPEVHEVYRALAPRPRRGRPGPDGRGRGLDPDARVDGRASFAPTSSTRPSTSPGCSPTGRPRPSRRSSPTRSPRSSRSAPRRPGCSATTTSYAT